MSLLQRRLAIGYTRASRLIDLMGISGIISDHKGSVARDVLITPQEWEQMKRLASAEAAKKGVADPLAGGAATQQALFSAGDLNDAPPFDTADAKAPEDQDDLGEDSYDRGERDIADLPEGGDDDEDEVDDGPRTLRRSA